MSTGGLSNAQLGRMHNVMTGYVERGEVPGHKLDRLATSYWTNFVSGKIEVYDDAKGGQWSRPPAFPSGAGGLVSTIDD